MLKIILMDLELLVDTRTSYGEMVLFSQVYRNKKTEIAVANLQLA